MKRKHLASDDEPIEDLAAVRTQKRSRKDGADAVNEPILLDLSFEEDSDTNANINDDIDIDIAALFEENASESIIIDKVPKKRNKFVWKIERKYDDLDEALDFLEEEGFKCYDYSDLKMGQKFYFRLLEFISFI